MRLDRRRDDVVAAAARRHLTNVRVFGSVARNEDTLTSDIDLLVSAAPGASLFDIVGFATEVEAFLGYPVDVVSDGGLNSDSRIIREARAVKPKERRPPDGDEGGERFILKSHLESSLVLKTEDEKKIAEENKRNERLSTTLDAMRSSLEKVDELISLGRDRFDRDWIVQDAAIMALAQIGEEVKRLPKGFISSRPSIEWSKIAGTRDELTHDDVDMDLDLVWDALATDIPSLRAAL